MNIVSRSSQILAQDVAAAEQSAPGGFAITVIAADTRLPLSGALVSIDNAPPRTTDIAGRLDLTGTAPGQHTFVVATADGRELTVSATVGIDSFQLTILLPAVAQVSVAAPVKIKVTGGLVGFRYFASGGKAPYKFIIGGGNLPNFVTMDESGVITGSIDYGGHDAYWVVIATDANGNIGYKFDVIHFR
jgi:hypothetical protein